jgi:hypothetical protein
MKRSLAAKCNRFVLQLAGNTNSVNVRTSEAGITLDLLPLVMGYWYLASSYECINQVTRISEIFLRK